MAIATQSTAAYAQSAAGGTTKSISMTISGSDLYLVALVQDQQGDTVTGVTWNTSETMTQLCRVSRGNANPGSLEIYAYGLANPTATTASITATRTGTIGTIAVAGHALTGAKQTGQPNTTGVQQGPTGTTNTVTLSPDTDVDGCAIIGTWIFDNGGITASTNMTSISTLDGIMMHARSTTFPQTTQGAFSGTVTGSNANTGGLLVAIEPAAATSHIKSADGILYANIKSMSGVAIANVKSADSVTN